MAHKTARAAAHPQPGVVVGFYVNDEDAGLSSLQTHIDQLTHLCPQWLALAADASSIDASGADPRKEPRVAQVLALCRAHHLPVVPILSNYDNGWQPQRVHRLLADPGRHHAFAERLRDLLKAHDFQGVNIDFEALSPADRAGLTHLMGEIYAVLHPAGLVVSQDMQSIPLDSPNDYAFDLAALAKVNDFIVYMAYDQHEEEHEPGPICGMDWFRKQWQAVASRVPADRLVLAVGNYAYDWKRGHTPASDLTFQAALTLCADAHEGEAPSSVIKLDPASLNPYYDYDDESDTPHRVWFMDATVTANAWTIAQPDQPRGVALWHLGAEDPTVWKVIGHDHLRERVDARKLEDMHFPYDVDYEGAGEILEVASEPRPGRRILATDAASGLINEVRYESLPSTYVIRLTGKQKDMIALTFDDGPDDEHTAPILDVLKQYGVPATFFVVGDNVERLPWLVRRTWDEGHELGNHTFFHPNLATVSDDRVRLEVNATQLAIEAVTGHSTLEFRAPYTADAQPETADEVRPLLLVGDRKTQGDHAYLTIGESIDPKDWDPWARDADNALRRDSAGEPVHRTAKDIADYTITEALAHHGNIVLLHDAGGDRSQTVAALPRIITELRKHGFRFVTVSQLMNKPARALNPPVAEGDRLLVDFEGWWFALLFGTQKLLYWAFLAAIFLGVLRVASMAALAVYAAMRRGVRPPSRSGPRVSVVIAAYNEDKGVARTIRTVLASEYDDLEVIVVDDGSKDRTAEVVAETFGDDPRVTLLRQENGGKASALNHGLSVASGEIIVSLDADTLFEPQTIPRLLRHFDDPSVGAVAGNVKVGNRVNIITRWQAIEYITSQNLDRRAYAELNAVSVVPGAVGAWRRNAVEQAGGYASDTLAEDTDLTWRIRCNGWRIGTDTEALAWTEAPETLGAFFKQRFRWTYGTLQALFKHRDALFRHGWFGWVALPFLWVYQFFFQVLSPLIDLQILLAVGGVAWATLAPPTSEIWWSEMAHRDLDQILFYYGLFFVVELCGALLAFRLDRENPWLLSWLFVQRLVYRQLMYAVVFKTIYQAVRGRATGWGKLERTNSVKAVEAEAVDEAARETASRTP